MLEEARSLGFLGPGPVNSHLDHADGFAAAITAGGMVPAQAWTAVDLGSGGGIPGLALALTFPLSMWVLVDAAVRRTAFLRESVAALDLSDRVMVAETRAEEFGRREARRGRCDVVVSRGFGPPAVTAECAAPLLGLSGFAVVSEPPSGANRWPAEGLALLGMTAGPTIRAAGASYQLLVQAASCPGRYPRRVGIPAKRPLFAPPVDVPRETSEDEPCSNT